MIFVMGTNFKKFEFIIQKINKDIHLYSFIYVILIEIIRTLEKNKIFEIKFIISLFKKNLFINLNKI